MSSDSLFRRLARNTGWLLGGKAANAVLGLGVLALAARALGAEGLGRLVLLHGMVQITAELVKFQSWQGVVRFGVRSGPGGLARVVGFSLLLDAAGAVVALAVLVLFGRFLADRLGWPPEVSALVPWYGTAVVAMVAGTATGVLRLFDRFDLLAAQSAVNNTLRLAGAAIAWTADGGLEAFALVWWGAAMAAGLMPFPLAARALRAAGTERPAWPAGIRREHPGILRFFLMTSLNAVIALAPGHAATLIVGTLLGPAAAGLFRVAKQIADAAAKPADFLAQALYPEAARLSAAEDRQRLRHVLGRLLAAGGVLAALAVALLAAVGEALLTLVGGPGFAAAAPLLVTLGVAAALVMAAAPLEPTLIALGRAGTVVAMKAGVAAVHLVLLAVLAPMVGLMGAGVAAMGAGALGVTLLWTVTAAALRSR